MTKRHGPAPDMRMRKLIYKLHDKEGKTFRAISNRVKRSVSTVHELYSKHVRDLSTG